MSKSDHLIPLLLMKFGTFAALFFLKILLYSVNRNLVLASLVNYSFLKLKNLIIEKMFKIKSCSLLSYFLKKSFTMEELFYFFYTRILPHIS